MAGEEKVIQGAPNFDKLQIVKKGVKSLTKSASNRFESIDVAHGLDFTPIVICFVEDDTGTRQPAPLISITSTGAGGYFFRALAGYVVSATNITFFIDTNSGSPDSSVAITRIFRYYLLREVSD
ncbi:hypothetical protein UFOVP585_46 [uncultured Caudovirales phage]|uniref:Uncharacterized protein n=1 Tax=uncultured Caudovirales phage TaxID=2100421 RepID=A0A6J5N108_9CAUD|nr:hypothetical protein UFOVP585_46 [uncultured Caudovirales phage]